VSGNKTFGIGRCTNWYKERVNNSRNHSESRDQRNKKNKMSHLSHIEMS